MRKTKLVIAFLVLFISVGIAAVTTSVLISGSTQLASNPDDFQVYFSNVLVNGEQDLTLVQSKNSLYFSNVLNEVGDSYVITYDVTNASKNYDADINISCSQGNEYISVVNEFDSSSYLSATSTRSGVLTISLKKAYAGEAELVHDVSCTIDSEAVERTSQGSGSVATPVSKYFIGREISIGDEKFNIIGETSDTVSMLAQYNIDKDTYVQTTSVSSVPFSLDIGWEYTPGPKEIDIQNFDGEVKTIVNNYVTYLKSILSDESVTGTLITLRELATLGCTISESYATSEGGSCANSKYIDWLRGQSDYWTRSADSENSFFVWRFSGVFLDYHFYEYDAVVRPVITVSKSVVDELIEKEKYRTYEIGEVITIDTESFNVISDNGDTVTMLAQWGVIETGLQEASGVYVNFSYENGWEYTPGPKEIDIRYYTGDAVSYLDNYQYTLFTLTGDESLSLDLITLTQLGELGCTISEDYTPVDGLNCESSPYIEWLVNDTWWWTKSAHSNSSEKVWVMDNSGRLYSDDWFESTGHYFSDNNCVRPVVTISKEYLPE